MCPLSHLRPCPSCCALGLELELLVVRVMLPLRVLHTELALESLLMSCGTIDGRNMTEQQQSYIAKAAPQQAQNVRRRYQMRLFPARYQQDGHIHQVLRWLSAITVGEIPLEMV